MNHHTTPEHRDQLWEHYRQALARYEAAKKATDRAEAARDGAGQACQAAHQAWETACAEEVRYGQVVRQTARAYQTATDAAFLIEIGIMPSSLLTSRQTVQ
jgi:hypothetical protein